MPKRKTRSHSKHKPPKNDPAWQLADGFGINAQQIADFRQSLDQLTDEDHVVLAEPQSAALPPPGREATGIFRLNRRGFGFLILDTPSEHGDLFVPATHTASAMTGDRVRARVIRRQYRTNAQSAPQSPYIGRVIEIIQRADKHFVGNLTKQGQHWVVHVDGRLLHHPVIIKDPHAKNAIRDDKVVIELIEYPTDTEPAQGVITEVLGTPGLPQVETLAVIRAYGLPGAFPSQALDQARNTSQNFDSKLIPPNRLDLTNQCICTIDPPDAKDFDDAINIHRFDPDTQPDGASYELGIHIADVSHFVTPSSALDTQAAARGNSIYLPRHVIPMLPEVLSNGVCSLQQGVNRYCKSIFIRYDSNATVLSQKFANTVIRSAKRLTYLEAQALIDGHETQAPQHAATTPTTYSRELVQSLMMMDELAKALHHRRLRDGMVVLSLPEVQLVFDDAGHVTDALPQDNAFTHTIIEMFMVEANEAAARLFASLKLPLIRRVHPDPDPSNLNDLSRFARVAGYNIPDKPTRAQLQNLLDSVRGKPAQHAVHLAVLKTMSKAEYATSLIGHFALASDHYTHFTSPIRRYTDLVVHRALSAYLEQATPDVSSNTKQQHKMIARLSDHWPDEKSLIDTSQHCSTTERNAESAERDLRYFLVLQLLSDFTGQDFDGTVTGVTALGLFIQVDRYLVDGFVQISDLPSATTKGRGERWKLNRSTGALVAQKSGKSITIGDRFTIRIVKVNPQARLLELVIVNPAKATTHKHPKPKAAGRTTQKPRRLKQTKKRSVRKRK